MRAGRFLSCLCGDRLAVKDAGTTPPKRQFEPGSLHHSSGTELLEAARPRVSHPGIGPQGDRLERIYRVSVAFASEPISTTCRIGPAMNILSRDKQIDIIAALAEGMSISFRRTAYRRSPRHDYAPWCSRRPWLR